MKKDKIFELKIEEDDELSGVDAISLVDEPAIEISWVAFNKTQENFVIPDGEDMKFSSRIIEKGQSEEELFADGWELAKEEFVSSSPNQPSFEDTAERLIRYKYVLNPEAPGAPIKETTREFCRDLLNKNLVYRVEDLDAITNDLGSSAMVWRGSYNCRHIWQKIEYRRGTKIVNKASITDGRIKGAESYDVLDLPQPDTRVPGKASFDKEFFGLPYFDNKEDAEKFAEKIGCKGSHEHILDGRTFYMPCDKHPEDMGYDVGGIGGYVDPGVKKKKKVIPKSLVEPTTFEDQAAEREKMSKQYFQIDNEEKRIVLGPAMVPDMKIFRKDALGNPYYVYFTAETIRQIAEKYMRNKYLDNNDEMHDGEALQDVYVIESWIKEDEHDKSVKYGFKDLPVGSWFVAMKIKNDEVWQRIKNGELNGFSVSGFFEEVQAFTKEEAFLYKVAEILKKY